MIWPSGIGSLCILRGRATPNALLYSIPDDSAVAIAVKDGDGVALAIVLGVVHSTILTSSVSFPHSVASVISTSLALLSPPPGALAIRSSAVLVGAAAGLAVFGVRPAGALLLHSHSSLVASIFSSHLLLNAMLCPMQ
jgi:hypothetical protein